MDSLFLVLSLFIPRITLIIFYFTGSIPYNSVPFVGDILLTVFIPRVLVLIYIVDNLGTSSPWFWIHLVVAVLVYISGNHYRRKRKKRKD
ncbi:MAG: hypothetical protein ISS16_02660 [Ignavibacteria bacterium]|nr:hypothetical protein [Ignavibacteria bacterium]